jgi:hypothetical protein
MKRLAVATFAIAVLGFECAQASEPEPIQLTGFVQGSFAFASQPTDGRIVGNLYLPFDRSFVFDAAMVRVERSAPADRVGTGFVVEAMAGTHASAVRAGGLDLGHDEDLPIASLVLNFPAHGLQLTVGKMATMLGYEVIETIANPNLSVGSQFVYIENFTDTGLDAAWARGAWSARARLVNGWDVVQDNNRRKTVFGRAGWGAGPHGIALLGYSGSELPDSIGGLRSGIELLANTRVGGTTVTLQADAGREEQLDAGWGAAGLWAQRPLASGIDLALRGDVLDDRHGARTSGVLAFPVLDRQRLSSATATLVIHHPAGALLRPEVRYDRSDNPVFDGHREQWTFGFGVAATF